MKLLLRCEHAVQAEHYANVLRAAGIRCSVRNTTLAGAIGDIPFIECAPQVWIDSVLDEARARDLLGSLQSDVQGPNWVCALCGESIEPQFGACWRCTTARPAG
jgi:hypothetical protein